MTYKIEALSPNEVNNYSSLNNQKTNSLLNEQINLSNPFLTLPLTIRKEIFSYLSIKKQVKLKLVCKDIKKNHQLLITDVELNDYLNKMPDQDLMHYFETNGKLIKKIEMNQLGNKINNDTSLRIITCCPNLEILTLASHYIACNALEHLAKLKHLKELYLIRFEEIIDAELIFVSKLDKLEVLYLINCKRLTDKSLNFLLELKNLKILYLNGCYPINENHADILSKLSIKKIHLYTHQITNEDAKFLESKLDIKINQVVNKSLSFTLMI